MRLRRLVQVLHEAHAGQFRALAYGLPRLADDVRGINQ